MHRTSQDNEWMARVNSNVRCTGRKFFIPSMIAGTLAVIGWLNRQRSLAEMRRYGYGVTTNVF